METFTCEKYHCLLTRQACADRQAARTINRTNRLPTYPGCQECAQGLEKTKGIVSEVKPTAQWHYHNNQITGGMNMGYPNKIDNEILKKRTAEGKNPNEIAKEFGCSAGAVLLKSKALSLTPNYIRKRSGTAGEAAARVRQSEKINVQNTEISGQIIPVTLRLNVEVNVRVVMEGVNAA